jgi:TPR repeat protein
MSTVSSNNSNSSRPRLPALYFESSRAPNCFSTTRELPSEVLSHCFSFSNWGDLAKLAVVQSSWSTILLDAAEHSSEAKWELAQALLKGSSGLAKNPGRALEILRELAQVATDENDHPVQGMKDESDNSTTMCFAPAMNAISELYFEGEGFAKDPSAGMAWLQAAFHFGNDLDAAYASAMLYEYGRNGIEVDVVAAFQWFEKAADAGHLEAMAELGLCYELGCGVEQNDEKALDWYTKAANEGHATAKFSVAEAFEEARGVPQSDEEACLWYYRAALVGDEDAKKALRRLYDIARIVVPGVAEILGV